MNSIEQKSNRQMIYAQCKHVSFVTVSAVVAAIDAATVAVEINGKALQIARLFVRSLKILL